MKELQVLNEKYYKAVAIKDWKTAKELLNEITEKQNKIIFGFYDNMKKM